MISKRNKLWFAIGLLIIIMSITNPTRNQFSDYKGWPRKDFAIPVQRTFNGIFFSIYEYNSEKYFGVLLNFFKM